MEQISDPPGDLTSDTPAKGKGGKETSEKRPAKQCWPDREKKPQQTNGPELICICIGHSGNTDKTVFIFQGNSGNISSNIHA